MLGYRVEKGYLKKVLFSFMNYLQNVLKFRGKRNQRGREEIVEIFQDVDLEIDRKIYYKV